jgi:hypothetical protein
MPLRYVTIDSPFASETIFHGTQTWGINDNGQVAGFYYPTGATNASAFYDFAGAFVYLNPGAAYHNIIATGITNSGSVVGYLQTTTNAVRGFVETNGTFGLVNDPLGTNGTFLYRASDKLEVGTYKDAGNLRHGFVTFDGTNFTTLDQTGATETVLVGVNSDDSVIVGYYLDAGGSHGYIDLIPPTGPSFTFNFDHPQGLNGTFVLGANNGGKIVGYYVDSAGYSHGFVLDLAVSFGEASGGQVLTTIDVPGALDTIVTGVNDAGRLVGYYYDSASVPHGFETITSAKDDFGGDGHADMLWRNANGTLAYWQMNGTSIGSSDTVNLSGTPLAPGASWSIVGESDFSGDGEADLLWRNTSGALSLWTMNGSNVVASQSVIFNGSTLAPDASWTVAAVGDFNGDGMSDMLWRNASGALSLWTMNGNTVTSAGR